ncbi:MAG: DUF6575 domain-containing protein [Trueperaceae bacterium]|nr:DUF6575 domain-containing protein [Trueperaceae bacterium]
MLLANTSFVVATQRSPRKAPRITQSHLGLYNENRIMPPIAAPKFAENLEIVEVYHYFDRPVLYSCRDAEGIYYLAVWSDEDPEASTEMWVFTPVDTEILDAVSEGALDLRAGFRNGRYGRSYIVTIDLEAGQSSYEAVASSDLDDNLLPEAGQRLTPSESSLASKAQK